MEVREYMINNGKNNKNDEYNNVITNSKPTTTLLLYAPANSKSINDAA